MFNPVVHIGDRLRRRRVWRELTWLAGGQLLAVAGAAVGVRIVTSVLPPAAYGELALGLTFANLLSQTILGAAGHAAERYFGVAGQSGQTDFFFVGLRRLLVGCCVALWFIGLLGAAGAAVFVSSSVAVLVVAATAFAMCSGLESVLDSVQNAARQRVVVAAHQAMRAWLRPLAVPVFTAAFGTVSVAAMSAYACASAVVLASQTCTLRLTRSRQQQTVPGFSVQSLETRMQRYAVPFAMWGFLAWVQASSDRWALQLLGNVELVGLYAVVAQLGAYPMTLLLTLVAQLVAPIIFAEAGDATDPARVRSALRQVVGVAAGMLLVTILMAVLTQIFHDLIFSLFVARAYANVAYLLPLSVAGAGVFNVGHIATWASLAVERPTALIPSKLVTTLLALVLNSAGAALLGVQGVVLGGVLLACCYAGWTALVSLHTVQTYFRDHGARVV